MNRHPEALASWTDLSRSDPASRVLVTLGRHAGPSQMVPVPGHIDEALSASLFRHAYLVLLGHLASPHGRVTMLQDRPTAAARRWEMAPDEASPDLVDDDVITARTDRLERREGVLTALRYILDIDLDFFAAMVGVPIEYQHSFRYLVEYADAVTVVRKRRAIVGAPLPSG